MTQLQTAGLLHIMETDDHPEKEIFAAVGDLSEIELSGQQILVGIYIQPSKTKGGIYTTKLSVESVYQGKVGIVLKLPNEPLSVGEQKAWGDKERLPKVGDWVYFNAGNGLSCSVCCSGAKRSQRLLDAEFDLDGWPCRIFDAEHIIGRIKSPRIVV